jgi:hypothetical protein
MALQADVRSENRILQNLAQHFLGSKNDENLLDTLSQNINWPLLLLHASREGMAGVAAHQLQQLSEHNEVSLPLEDFNEALTGIFLKNGHHFAELAKLRERLVASDVRVLLLKGSALIETVYEGQMGLRPLSDVDVFVKPKDIPILQEQLRSLGFQSPPSSPSMWTNGPVAFDIHTDLIGSGRIRRRSLAVSFDEESFWAKAGPAKSGASHLAVLCPEHQFLHLAFHALKHSYSRMIWLVDLGLVSRQLDWSKLLHLAESYGALRSAAYATRCLETLMNVEIPDDVRGALPSLNKVESGFIDLVKRRRPEMEALGEPLVAFSIPTWGGRLAYLFEYTFPRRHVLAGDASSRPAWQVYTHRMSEIFKRSYFYVKVWFGSLLRRA